LILKIFELSICPETELTRALENGNSNAKPLLYLAPIALTTIFALKATTSFSALSKEM